MGYNASPYQLEGDLRRAFENYCADRISGPWDDLIETLAGVVHNATMDLETAARINLLLARTRGGTAPDECSTCKCPSPGMAHERLIDEVVRKSSPYCRGCGLHHSGGDCPRL